MLRMKNVYVEDLHKDKFDSVTADVVLNEIHVLKEIRNSLSPGNIPGDLDRVSELDVLIRSFEKRPKE